MGSMKKTLLYLTAAVILGLLMILVPLVTLAQTKPDTQYMLPESLSRSLRDLEGTRQESTLPPGSDIEILAVSFVFALIAYLLYKRRRPHIDYGLFRVPFQF